MRLVVAILTTAAGSSLVAFALALRAGLLLPAHAATGFAAGALLGVLAHFQTRRGERRPVTRWDILVWVAFALFAISAFGWLLYYDRDLLRVGVWFNAGDLSRHILYSKMFASGQPIWPDHPLHAWAALRYYPGADFFQAMLEQMGFDERLAFTWSGLTASVLAAVALRRWGGAFATAGFLFAGGLAGFAFFWTGVVKDYQMPLAWKPLATSIFLTQRGFLFALPAGLVLLAHWRGRFFPRSTIAIDPPEPVSLDLAAARAWLRPGRHPDLISPLPAPREASPFLPLWIEALLLIGLAWFQLYAFLFLVALLGFWLMAYFPQAALRRHVGVLLALALPPAAALVALMTDFGAANSIHWQPGWMQKPRQDAVGFWIINFGFSLLLSVWLWTRLAWRRGRSWLENRPGTDAAEAFVLPAGVAFLLCTFISFAPWEWDNTKLMIWSYLIVLPFLWELMIAPAPVIVRWIVCFALFFSGAVSLAGGLREKEKGYELAKRSQLDELAAVLRDIPLSARFACAPEYNHPLVLSGRRIAMGYDGHLFGYGLPYDDLRREVETLMLGRPGWEKSASRLGVTHVYWGPNERKRYPKSTQPWRRNGRVIASGDWGEMIELGTRSSPVH